jgi:hypothetical protein
MNDTTVIKPPNELLAEIVTQRLLDSGSMPANKADDIFCQLKNGNATAQDWRLWAELSLPREPEGEAGVEN